VRAQFVALHHTPPHTTPRTMYHVPACHTCSAAAWSLTHPYPATSDEMWGTARQGRLWMCVRVPCLHTVGLATQLPPFGVWSANREPCYDTTPHRIAPHRIASHCMLDVEPHFTTCQDSMRENPLGRVEGFSGGLDCSYLADGKKNGANGQMDKRTEWW